MKKFKQYLQEMALPAKFDEKKFNEKNSFRHKISYFMNQARRIGAGSSRIAFVVNHYNRPVVIKVAKNKKGLVQNEHEVEMMSDYYLKDQDIIIPLIDYDKENSPPYWIMTEYAEKATSADFKRVFNVDNPRDVIDCIDFSIHRETPTYTKESCSKINSESDEYTGLYNMIGSYDRDQLSINEFKSASNWGKYNGRLVIIDIGASKYIMDTFYLKH